MFVLSIVWNCLFLHNWFDTNLYNSLNWIFCFFLSYEFVLVFIIRSCNSNLALFAWSYFFFLAHFNIFIVDVFCFKWFFNFFYNWLDTNLDNFVYRFFSCCEFTFFGFSYFAVFDYKSICSFLFSWCSASFFSLARFKIFVILNFSFERKFFLFFYFMSTIICAFTN